MFILLLFTLLRLLKTQAAPAPAAALPAKLSLDYKEHVLLKELSSSADFKFTLQPSQDKLTNIKCLYTWFANIANMLDKFPDVEQFLFGTAATLNEGKHLTLETTTCKTEAGVKAETASGEKLHQITSIKHELDSFQQDTIPRSSCLLLFLTSRNLKPR